MTTSLREIPGIGERMETHLRNIGVNCVEELVGRSPEELFKLFDQPANQPYRMRQPVRVPEQQIEQKAKRDYRDCIKHPKFPPASIFCRTVTVFRVSQHVFSASTAKPSRFPICHS